MKNLTRKYPVVLTQDVIWGDLDAFGHINNTVYFRYFEDARIPDHIHIATRSSILSPRKFNMEYVVFSEKHDAIAAEGEGLIVYYDYADGKSCEIPEVIVSAMNQLARGRI
jgi:acyl-CoA thioester hydrolase